MKQEPSKRETRRGELLATALQACGRGISVVPPEEDGSKAPFGKWKKYQKHRATPEQIKTWYRDRQGLGFVCGEVSDGLELLEFDDLKTYTNFKKRAKAVGLGKLTARLEEGYVEETPGGGIHWLYRTDQALGNTMLARRPLSTTEGSRSAKVKTLIETRGEGGYVIVAPTAGPVHPTGKPYRLRAGGVKSIPRIRPADRDALWELARSFDEMPRPEPRKPTRSQAGVDMRPGDDFNARATWQEVLEPARWALVYRRGDETFWRRPGKSIGVSATTGFAGNDWLYVFSTSTHFEANRSYDKFGAYALLNFDGNFAAAAAGLAKKGYGVQARKGKGETQLDVLLRLVKPLTFCHDSLGRGYAIVNVKAHLECLPVRSTAFRRWLIERYLSNQHRAPNAEALQNALNTCDARAHFEGKEEHVGVRVTKGADEAIYIDLGNPKWEAVRINRAGWEIVNSKKIPVRFRRPRGMLPLPRPTKGGSIKDLKPFFNLGKEDSDASFALIVGALGVSLLPTGPFFVIEVGGEQGTGKSTACRVFRQLVDPNAAPLRSPPDQARDLAIGANNAWLLAFDNLSTLAPWLSDGLCRLATGGGYAIRSLYTNDEEEIFPSMRPVLINGIGDVASYADILDRCLVLRLPHIPDDERLREKDFWHDFNSLHPKLFGVLLRGLARALSIVETISYKRLPRMADAALFGEAFCRALGFEEDAFMRAYRANRKDAVYTALENSSIAAAIVSFMERRPSWTGTFSELLQTLSDVASPTTTRLQDWPRSAKGMSSALWRAQPALRRLGILVKKSSRSGKRREITLRVATDESGDRRSRLKTARNGQESSKQRGQDFNDSASLRGKSPDGKLPSRNGVKNHRVSSNGHEASANGRAQTNGRSAEPLPLSQRGQDMSPEDPPRFNRRRG